jgi:two-component system, NtrC family, response regulator AtoC
MSAGPATRSSLQVPLVELPPQHVIFGQSSAMAQVRQKIEKVAAANVPVLIRGESGTGKEMVAKMLHQHSPWSGGPFVKVNCPAIPGTLLESELFGYEKGAFTGAYGSKPGRVEMAHRGTLFLDEVGELEPALQAKLLQLLQDGQFCRIGAQEDMRVEVRIVCATNRNLEEEIDAGNFRQDLFYRINVVSIELPLLAERREDIPVLVDYFLAEYSAKYKREVPPPSAQLLRKLAGYSWPGNIRELENLIKRYVILGLEEAIASELVEREIERPSLLPELPGDGSISLKKVTREATQDLERRIIQRVLEFHNWNRKRAARALNISYRALLYKIRQTGLAIKPRRNGGSGLEAEARSTD